MQTDLKSRKMQFTSNHTYTTLRLDYVLLRLPLYQGFCCTWVKEHVILVQKKPMSVTLFKTLNLSHCMPEGFQDNYFHILLWCQKLSATNISNGHLLINVLSDNTTFALYSF